MSAATYLAVGASLIFIYIGLCAALHGRRTRLSWYCLPIGLLAASTYALNMWYVVVARGGTLYNGLTGDNSFQVAYINNVLHGNYIGDFYDKLVPSHYPPLYFWVAGTLGRVVGADALAVAVIAPALVLLVSPAFVVWIGRYLGGERVGFYGVIAFFALGNAMISYFLETPRSFPPMTWAIYKPHELLAGLLTVLWVVHLGRHLYSPRRYARHLVVQALMGGVLFLLYYPWFAIGAAAILLFVMSEALCKGRGAIRPLMRFAAVIGLSLVLGAIAWVPYLATALILGAESNYAWQFVTLSFFDISLVTLGLGYAGSIFVLGIYALYSTFRTRRSSRVLTLMLGILFVWFASAFVTYPLLQTAFLSWKGRILVFVVLAFGAGLGLELVRRRWPVGRRVLSSPFLVCLVVLPLLPTILQWNPVTDSGLRAALEPLPSEVTEIVTRLESRDTVVTVLASTGVAPYLPAVSQSRLFLSHNIHFSNPLARFADRKQAVKALQRLSAEDLAQAMSRFGIDALILDKLPDGSLGLLVPESAFPTSVFDGDWPYAYEQVKFTPQQLDPAHFVNVYEDRALAVFRIRAPAATR